MKRVSAALAIACLALATSPAAAWEPETTHAGLAEQAALASKLHKRLVSLGFSGGLFEPMTIPPADAPNLFAAVRLLSPTHGAVPDARGRQVALSWLSAGAALADVPSSHGASHFFDPATREGWRAPNRGVLAGLSDTVREAIGRASLPDRGIPATEWVISKNNPFNYSAFLTQYEKAVTAKTPGERSRHMAAALIAAGAILHTLGDLGVPSRVRSDPAAHLEPLGAGPDDLGSRFERIAALAHGRLGVPAPTRTVTRTSLHAFFSSGETGDGLADVIARSFFSPNTLPGSTRIGGKAQPPLARPLPALPWRLNLMAASRDDGTTLRDTRGICLARYKVEHSIIQFWLDDDCMLEQIAVILPEVAAYEAGLLDYLIRGELTITIAGQQLEITGKVGAGSVTILVEDERGVRTSLGTTQVQSRAGVGGEGLAVIPMPTSGVRVVAVYSGTDAETSMDPLVAVGSIPLTR